MCDNEDGAVKLWRPVVVTLPEKHLCAWQGIEYGVPRILRMGELWDFVSSLEAFLHVFRTCRTSGMLAGTTTLPET
jgi:hypothetical protein